LLSLCIRNVRLIRRKCSYTQLTIKTYYGFWGSFNYIFYEYSSIKKIMYNFYRYNHHKYSMIFPRNYTSYHRWIKTRIVKKKTKQKSNCVTFKLTMKTKNKKLFWLYVETRHDTWKENWAWRAIKLFNNPPNNSRRNAKVKSNDTQTLSSWYFPQNKTIK
jgi:hypothetical protein